jgi:hypothetical protein
MHLGDQLRRGAYVPLLLMAGGLAALAQDGAQTPLPQSSSIPQTSPVREDAEKNVSAPCFEPPPLVRWEDYHGPFARLVGALGRRAERTSVHPPHYRPDATLCSLEPREKFDLFVRSSLDPMSFLTAGFNAGISPESDSSFGQGAEGYAKRFGAAFADETSARFFGTFAFPTLLREDPRYYRLAHGSTRKRLAHAVTHVVITHSDNGRARFNFSEWLATGSATALSYAWHPGNAPGLGPGIRIVGFDIAGDALSNVVREFWPEIARAFHLPFSGSEPVPAKRTKGQ